MDPFSILRHEHKIILEHVSDLEEMTYSVSVNLRDFSLLFRSLVNLWNRHEKKEELLFKVLSESGYNIPIEKLEFEHGELKNLRIIIMDAINDGGDEKIKEVLENICGNLIDLLKSHTLAEEIILENISWDKLKKETIDKIELLQIIDSEKLLED